MIGSKIEWTNDTWNPWHGCKKISAGCKNCYMYRDKARWGQNGADIRRASKAIFNIPYRLKGPFVFTCSWSDFFIEEADNWRPEAWKIIRETPHLTYQILTKRPELIKGRLPEDWASGYPNVWLGVSVESQEYVYRMDILRAIPAKLRFVSAEPLLGFVAMDLRGFDWVITGGESGPGCRPMNDKWALAVHFQCEVSRVAHFHKQNGGTKKIGGVWGGKELAGQVVQQMPEAAYV